MRRISSKVKEELSVESFRHRYFRVSQHFVMHKSIKIITERLWLSSHWIVCNILCT